MTSRLCQLRTIQSMTVKLLLVLTLSGSAQADTKQSQVSPNIVVFLADDQGWGDLSIHGNTNVATPRIDSLAKDGALFERFYVCPVCAPTRAEMLTGRWHPRGGVRGVSTGQERLDLDEKTMADVFRSAGYATGAFGKWHNGSQYPYHPIGRGFEQHYGFCHGHWGDYFSPPLEANGQPIRGEGYLTDDLTTHALQFIEQHRNQPFLCYIPFNTPHSPMQVPDKYFDRFRDHPLPNRHLGLPREIEDLAMTRAALAMCENIDWNVGRVLDRLKSLDLESKTIVFYFSDNGPNSFRWNAGMKGRKGSTDEGGVRSPLLVRWPGHIKPGTRVSQISSAIDLLPTLVDLTGIKSPDEKLRSSWDGISLVPALRGENPVHQDRLIFSHWVGKVSVRSQRFRLDADGKLFHMEQDPGQRKDVTEQFPEESRKLKDAVAEWRRTVLSEMGPDSRPYPVGYPQLPLTILPARDGVPHGTIQRSARAPNCSYFTNWKSTADSITWDIEVAHPGEYAVEVEYTCPASDVGSVIEVTFQKSRLESAIQVPHDPPARGAENDRVTREGESLVKDFRTQKLGVMKLEAQRGLVTLRALKIPGQQVGEIQSLILTRLAGNAKN